MEVFWIYHDWAEDFYPIDSSNEVKIYIFSCSCVVTKNNNRVGYFNDQLFIVVTPSDMLLALIDYRESSSFAYFRAFNVSSAW